MTPAESHSSQSQLHFLEASCQSGREPEQMGGPGRVSETEKVKGKKKRTEN